METLGYYDSFNLAHTLSYSFVALQEMNLARFYPVIFWNTANLIVDSGAEFTLSLLDENGEIIEFEDENDDDDDETQETSSSNYGKIATAIGKMQYRGIRVLPPSVNHSNFTYTPNVETNSINYGLTGIVKVGDSVIQEILAKRPFSSFEDFMNRVKANKTQMISLIKSGAFDEFGDRYDIMVQYIDAISDKKKRLTLQNVGGLIEKNMFPSDFAFEIKVFNFNKYLRKFKDKVTDMITLDETAYAFYEANFDVDLVSFNDGQPKIAAGKWKPIYDKYMARLRTYIQANQKEMLEQYNHLLYQETWDKYATGSVEKWSMDSVSFYQDRHELEGVDLSEYGVINFQDFTEEPQVERSFKAKDGHIINMFRLGKIAGTVIDRNKTKNQITLLTTDGVVTVQAYGVMPQYDKQISEVGSDGKKHVIEKSWFTRGNKIIVQGMRRGESIFVAKKYASTPGHHFTLIKEVLENGELVLQEERIEVSE